MEKVKVKLKERFENAFDAFFEDEKFDANDSLSLANYETNSPIEKIPFFSETTHTIFNIFRQIFFFLPGNFLLFFLSVVFTGITLLQPVWQNGRGTFVVFLTFLLLSLMTVFGIGNLRQPKHYLIPLSTILIGIATGIVGSILFGDKGFGYFLRDYVPYFIPLAFIAPILVKSWVDQSE